MIAVAPVGDRLGDDLFVELVRALASAFHAGIFAAPAVPLPSSAYDHKRRQYHSTAILRQLARAKPPHAERLLGVTDVDLYVPELNFVFGEADPGRGVALISLARLQTGSTHERGRGLFLKRAATEALHELGHTYRLDHCANPQCVMWFSNTLAETDRNGSAFCPDHASQLARGSVRSHRDRGAGDSESKPAGTLVDRLELIFEWYKGMVDERTGRLLYVYDPANEVTTGDGEPIRDIAAIWDIEVLSAFLGRDDLQDVIRRSLDHFDQRVVARNGYAIVAPGGESSSIAPSAFLALALTCSDLPDKLRRLTPLVDGILRQQREEGSYKIFFDTVADSGEELYPAEAMLALLEAHRLTRDARLLESVERGFVYYKRSYYDRGLVDPDAMVFFANWQSQTGRPLLQASARPEIKDLVRAFLLELHDAIIKNGFYDRVARTPERQACVEVACALEGLADAYAIAVSSRDRRAIDYRQCIGTLIAFLVRAQRMTDCTDRERGGFGGSLASREQRIDVTGHVASGFIKCVENGITTP